MSFVDCVMRRGRGSLEKLMKNKWLQKMKQTLREKDQVMKVEGVNVGEKEVGFGKERSL